MRGQLETRRHRVHGVGSLESIAASPSVSLFLCVSKSVQGCADSWKHGGTEFTETAAWNLLPPLPLWLCISVFQNPSRDARTVGNTEAQSSRRPQPEIYCRFSLCVSVSLCFKIRPGSARTVGNTEAQSSRSRKPGVYCRLSLCGSASLCFKIRPGSARTVGNTEAQSSRSRQPEIHCRLPLCVSVSLCFKIRPGSARTVGNTEAQSSRSR
jgi:hypothetical protein